MLSVVTARYARALVDVISAPGSNADPARVLQELRAVEQLIAASPDLRTAMLSPAVAPSRKRAVMAKLLAPMNILPQVRNFVFVVIDHRRADQLGSIIEAVEGFLDERMGYVRADVESAQELTTDQKANLERQLSRLAGKKTKLRFSMNPALIAGVVAHMGSKVYDGSVRGQLDRLRVKLGRG